MKTNINSAVIQYQNTKSDEAFEELLAIMQPRIHVASLSDHWIYGGIEECQQELILCLNMSALKWKAKRSKSFLTFFWTLWRNSKLNTLKSYNRLKRIPVRLQDSIYGNDLNGDPIFDKIELPLKYECPEFIFQKARIVLNAVKDEETQKVLSLVMEGENCTEIGQKLGLQSQRVATIIAKVRDVCIAKGLAEV